jgi:predicted RNA binding protein YcfA (HicA-like mRNA interferase family)
VPKLKRLTAKQVLAIFMQFGFVIASQRGSHIKLTRIRAGCIEQRETHCRPIKK